MRFSCEKCWDNPCTCGHDKREGDKLRAEFARDNPPPDPLPPPLYQADPCEEVGTFARRLIQAAEKADDLVSGTHNSFTLCAWPGALVTDVLASWNAKQRSSYMGGDR